MPAQPLFLLRTTTSNAHTCHVRCTVDQRAANANSARTSADQRLLTRQNHTLAKSPFPRKQLRLDQIAPTRETPRHGLRTHVHACAVLVLCVCALSLSHTQHIGHLFSTRFKGSQFIVVSLKEGLFSNANVLFRARFRDGTSVVERVSHKAGTASAPR